MKSQVTSFKEMIETVVRDSFESEMLEALEKIEAECIEHIKKRTESAKREARKMANAMAVELLQKSDISGMSFELKL